MIVLTGESGCDASGVRHSCSTTETQRFDWDDDVLMVLYMVAMMMPTIDKR